MFNTNKPNFPTLNEDKTFLAGYLEWLDQTVYIETEMENNKNDIYTENKKLFCINQE